MTMRRIFTCLILLSFPALRVLAQNPGHNTFLKFNPTTLPNELDLSLEHEFGQNMSLEAGAGFIYTDYWDYLLNQMNFGQIKPNISEYQYIHGMGYDARLGIRYYVISSYAHESTARGTYFEPLLLFKYVTYPNNKTIINDENYWNHADKNVMGAQLLIGREHQKGKFIFDNYIGLGVKAKTYHYDHYYGDASGEAKDGRLRTTNWLPSLQLGVKIGLRLNATAPTPGNSH